LIEESACIVLAPLKSCKADMIDSLCDEIKNKKKLKELVDIGRLTLKRDIPYILIWDNPNRIIKRYKYQNESLKQG
jgi:hypothetical protein